MAVREGLLTLLSAGPQHGYQLKAELEATTAAAKPINIGQIYTTLDRLSRDGFVEEVGAAATDETTDSRRRPYRLTPDGRDALDRWFSAVPSVAEPLTRSDLVDKVMLALAASSVDALAVVRAQREGLVARLQAVRREQRTADGLARQLVIDADAARLEADIGWLDRCEERFLHPDNRTTTPRRTP